MDITPTRRTNIDKVVDRDADDDDENEVDGDGKEKSPKLFSCPAEGCTKNYHRYSSIETHLEYGVCKLKLERQSLLDKAKAMYEENLLHGAREQPVMKSSDTRLVNRDGKLPLGWTLRTTKSSKRFNERQKSYLNEKFNIGNETGHKLDPETVSQDMCFSRDSESRHVSLIWTITWYEKHLGQFFRRFILNEFLTAPADTIILLSKGVEAKKRGKYSQWTDLKTELQPKTRRPTLIHDVPS